MNASMARRIRNAEAVLIYALDSRRADRRDCSRRNQTARPPQPKTSTTGASPLGRQTTGQQ